MKQQSERDKVLDNLEWWMPDNATITMEGHIPTIWVDDLYNWIKELRQAGE